VCDRELMRKGISLYQVPQDRVRAKSWMEVGYQLYDALGDGGYSQPREQSVPGSAIEIYPYAGFAALLGQRPLKKTTVEGLAQRVEILRDKVWSGTVAPTTTRSTPSWAHSPAFATCKVRPQP